MPAAPGSVSIARAASASSRTSASCSVRGARRPSRGKLIPAFLADSATPEAFLSRLETDAPGYSGFNLLIGDPNELWYASNRMDRFAQQLPAGIHGLSNELLDSPWPKLQLVRRNFEAWLTSDIDAGVSGTVASSREAVAALLALLADRTAAPEGSAPTGLSPEWERTLSSPFVTHPTYGTRCSTVLLIEPSGAAVLVERRFAPSGEIAGDSEFFLNAERVAASDLADGTGRIVRGSEKEPRAGRPSSH